MLRRLYDWTIALSASPWALWALAAVAFAESSFFPLPPDLLLLPMALARPRRAWLYALVCTVSSVLGGILGYAIGALLYDTVGHWLIGAYGYGDSLHEFRRLYQEWGQWIILIKGLTPIPYKLVTIASGLAGYNLFWFIVLSIITRGIRFFLIAALIHRFGAPIRDFIEHRLGLVMGLFAVAIIGGFALVKFVV
jgi:membrane protein YqaA with SNARE-associated domain